jgi:sterol 3beta-glucosyltransferase
VSAEVLESTRKGEEETTFAVTTDERKYQFKADSAASAKEWARAIQKIIFRTHNEGSSVKISLPIQNVLEIEESSILDLANTVKVRVIDNDETFAIDEVSCCCPLASVLANHCSTSFRSSTRVKMRSTSCAS